MSLNGFLLSLEPIAKNLFIQFKLVQRTGGIVLPFTFCPTIMPQAMNYRDLSIYLENVGWKEREIQINTLNVF